VTLTTWCRVSATEQVPQSRKWVLPAQLPSPKEKQKERKVKKSDVMGNGSRPEGAYSNECAQVCYLKVGVESLVSKNIELVETSTDVLCDFENQRPSGWPLLETNLSTVTNQADVIIFRSVSAQPLDPGANLGPN
jgi:hypothetical protein